MYLHCKLKKKNQKERCQSIFVDVWFEKIEQFIVYDF